MRIDPEVLLVLLAILLPFIVQIRTVAGFVGIELTTVQHASIGSLIMLGVILWAMMDGKRPAASCHGGDDG